MGNIDATGIQTPGNGTALGTENVSWARRGGDVWMGGAVRPDLVFERGAGSWLHDVEGRTYLDFVAGWAVGALGHSATEIVEALQGQSKALIHCSPGFWNPAAIRLAEAIAANTGMERVFLGTTGAEANECAIKLARKWGKLHREGAFRVVTTWKGFHGRTLATMAATGKSGWAEMFGPGCPGFDHADFGDLESLLATIGPETCAVMLEPIQGEGGVWPAGDAYLAGVRDLCDRAGILLIADEVQTGWGRCGAWLASEGTGMRPDIVTLGKGLGGGIPVSACATRRELDLFQPGEQGGTFTYHPVGAAVALAVIEAIESRGLLAASRVRGTQIEDVLDDLATRHGISNLRGRGLLRAFDLGEPRAAELVRTGHRHGLLLNATGATTIRICPALTVSEGEVEEFGRRLEASLRSLEDPGAP